MDLQNEGHFNDVVTRIFQALAVSFPLSINIEAVSLGVASEPAYKRVGFNDESTEAMPEHIFVRACVEWLESEGYLKAEKITYVHATSVVLTEKGLLLIGASPTSLLRGNYA